MNLGETQYFINTTELTEDDLMEKSASEPVTDDEEDVEEQCQKTN